MKLANDLLTLLNSIKNLCSHSFQDLACFFFFLEKKSFLVHFVLNYGTEVSFFNISIPTCNEDKMFKGSL